MSRVLNYIRVFRISHWFKNLFMLIGRYRSSSGPACGIPKKFLYENLRGKTGVNQSSISGPKELLRSARVAVKAL